MSKENTDTKYFEDLFQSINQASALLMDVNPDTFGQRLLEAMGVVAKTVDVDRIYLWKNFLINGKLHGTQLYEWSYKVEPAQDTDLTVKVLYEDAFPDMEEPLSKGGNVNTLVRDMAPGISEYLAELGILSILVEPIFIEGEFWGFVGFDNCHNERIFTDIEERILKSIAVLFGRAYHHNEERNLIESLNQVSILLLDTNPDTFEQRLIEAMGIVAQAVKIDCVYLWKNHTLNEKLYCSQVFEWSPEKTMFANGELFSYDDVVPGWDKTLSGGNCINSLVRNLTPLEQDHLSPSGILSILVIPVFIDDLFWGFVGFDDCQIERTFTNTEVEKLRSMALLFGNAYLHNEANRLIREQNEFQLAIYNEIPVGVSINDEHMNLIDCNPVFVKMLGAPKEKMIKNIFDFFPEYQPDGMKSIDKNPELFDQALRGQIPKVKWNYLLPDGKLSHCEITMKSIVLNGKPTVLVFAYDLSETKKLKSEVASLKDKIYEDGLTGIHNRRYFDVRTNRIMKLLAHANGKLGLFMIDIDQFEEYNDGYGHQKGDECIKTVAQILSKSIGQSGDFVARYGGDEFAIVLPLTDAEGACVVAERIIKNIHEANIPHKYSNVANHVTLSIGVTSGIVDSSLTIDDFVKVADDLLYVSKNAGRNRYTFKEMGKEN